MNNRPNGNSTLSRAIESAVQDTLASAQDLRSKVLGVMEQLQLHPARGESGLSDGLEELIQSFTADVVSADTQVRGIFDRQVRALSAFNIVLFGRTGAGKSTLIEALTFGDGSSVSDGHSDWTKEVSSRQWNSCVLFDTPGINGWGNGENRAVLEDRARLAVENADLVLLCFDGQSQQASEFDKVARWVGEYGKACISVLNVRNPGWRRPTKVRTAAARKNLSDQVLGHAENIRTELARCHLNGVPVIAMSSQLALAARAAEPFRGPYAGLLTVRAKHSVPDLTRWSNIEPLESLVVELLRSKARRLRLGALNGQVSGVLDQLDKRLASWASKALSSALTLEKQLEMLFGIFGYPDHESAVRKSGSPGASESALSELERLRGEPFQSAVEGRFQVAVKHKRKTAVATLRAEALQRAEAIILRAFERGQKVTQSDFEREVFDQDKIGQTRAAIIEDAKTYIKDNVHYVSEETATEFELLATEFSLDAESAEALKKTGRLIRIASTVGTLLSVVAGFVAPWVGVITGVLSALFGWFGKKKEESAEQERLKQRQAAVAKAHTAVLQQFETIDDVISKDLNRIARLCADRLCAPLLHDATLLRKLHCHFGTTAELVLGFMAELPPKVAAQELLKDAVLTIETHGNGARTRVSTWLGEDWIRDPTGLLREDPLPRPGRPVPQCQPEQRNAVLRAVECPNQGSGRQWAEVAARKLRNDASAQMFLKELDRLRSLFRPRVVLCGDYNSGKSSLARRLLLEAGCEVPENLVVDAMPTTAVTTEYNWHSLVLVDSPGFQSGRKGDTEVALDACADAAVLLYVFQPNLITGDFTAIDRVLIGSGNPAFAAPKARRSLYLINRIDELGVDPEFDPEAFVALCARKSTELARALQSRGLQVMPEEVFCIASDPYGIGGKRMNLSRSEYIPYCSWDGITSFMECLDLVNGRLSEVGGDISVLEGGLIRLEVVSLQATGEHAELIRKTRVLEKTVRMLDTLERELNDIGGTARADLDLIMKRYATEKIELALSAQTQEDFNAVKSMLEGIDQDEVLKADLDHWHRRFRSDIEDWTARVASDIGRRLQSREFAAAFAAGHRLDVPDLNLKNPVVGKVLGNTSDLLKLLGQRDIVYSAGKFIGWKFRPWGAVHGAKAIANAAAVVGVAAAVFEVWSMVQDDKQLAKLERARREMADKVVQFIDSAAEAVFKEGSHSPAGCVAELSADLRKMRTPTEQAIREIKQDSLQVEARIAEYLKLAEEAQCALGAGERATV